MKKLLTMLIVFSLVVLTSEVKAQQNGSADPEEVLKKLGESRTIELYYTEKLGEELLGKKTCPCVRNIRYAGKVTYYIFDGWALAIFPKKINVESTENSGLTITSRFLSANFDGTELLNGDKPKAALECIKKRKTRKS